MTARTFVGPHGDRREISAPHLSDEEVAGRVRMLMRDQLDHEAVCTLGRDRIMCLTEELATARARISELEALTAALLKAVEASNRTMERAGAVIDDTITKLQAS